MKSFVRISALLWADILVEYALFVMQGYLTGVWNLSFTHAAAILNFWGGISKVLPAVFLFLVDALLGNFGALVISSIAYSVGIGFVTMSTPPVLANSTGTCKQYEPECIGNTQRALFYTGYALIAVGVAGNGVSVRTFLNEQQDRRADGTAWKDCLRIPGYTFIVIVPIVGAFALPYVKPWSLRFGIPAICTAVATFFFLSGWCTYDKDELKGSPLINVCRVLVASARKQSQPFPDDDKQFYRKDDQEPQWFTRTRCLRCLHKAAIVLPEVSREDQVRNRWRLCSVAEVEEAKVAIRMIPMWITFIICGVVSSIGNTYFVEQASNMNRNIGKWRVPLQIFLLLSQLAKAAVFTPLAGVLLLRARIYAPSVGIAVAMICSVLCCIAAAGIERRRLKVITSHGLLDNPDAKIPMSIFWLLFQFILLAGLDSFFEKSVGAFFESQAPSSMKKYLDYFTKAVCGLGFMCSVLTVYVVGVISERGGKPNWFQNTLNRSRLDRYYWVLAGLSSVNLLVFILVALTYRYTDRELQVQEADANTGAEMRAAMNLDSARDDEADGSW